MRHLHFADVAGRAPYHAALVPIGDPATSAKCRCLMSGKYNF